MSPSGEQQNGRSEGKARKGKDIRVKRRKKKQEKKTLVSLEMLMELCRVELPLEFMKHAGFLNVLQKWYGLLAWSKSGAEKEFSRRIGEKLETLSRMGCGIGDEEIRKQGMVRRAYT